MRRILGVDTDPGRSYKALAFAAAVVVTLSASEGWAISSHGLGLPSGSVEVGENRFRSGSSWEETLRFFNTVLKGQTRKPVASIPGVKAIHYDNPESSGWEGVNVYQRSNGEVRIFVIPKDAEAAPKKAEKVAEKLERAEKGEEKKADEKKPEEKGDKPEKKPKKKKSQTQ